MEQGWSIKQLHRTIVTSATYQQASEISDAQLNSDPYFHGKSFDEIVTYTTAGSGSGCGGPGASTGNSAPTVEAGAAYSIPSRTPFALTGSATDPESNPLTYCWEQFNLGAADSGSTLTDNGSRPIFRSFNPTTSATRFFPKLSDVLAGTTTYGETMPTTSRMMNFHLTVRANRYARSRQRRHQAPLPRRMRRIQDYRQMRQLPPYRARHNVKPVSSTHLTLPPSDLV